MSKLRDVTCHKESHSVTCHPTQVNAPRLTPATQAGTRFTCPGGMEGWVNLVDLIASRPGVESATCRSRVRRRTAAPPRQGSRLQKTSPIFDLQGSFNALDTPINNILSEFCCIFKLNINISQFCLLNNTSTGTLKYNVRWNALLLLLGCGRWPDWPAALVSDESALERLDRRTTGLTAGLTAYATMRYINRRSLPFLPMQQNAFRGLAI